MRPADGTVTYQSREYRLHDGRVLLDWRDRPALTHRSGCRLCCTYRVRSGGQLRHPIDLCPQCGPAWEHRRPDRCRYCGTVAHFLDDGRPVHKACLENDITMRLLGAGRAAA